MTVAADKHAMRQVLKGRRARLDEKNRAYAALKLGGNVSAFFDSKHLPDTATVGAYWPLRDEIDIRPALAALMAQGAHVAYPCVHEDHHMEFYYVPPAELDGELPPFIAQPARSHPVSACEGYQLVAPDDLDALFVPALGFDRHKHRLGSGAGCYDRYLARVPDKTLLIGVAFDEQLCDEVPVESHDRDMDFLITPSVII